MATHIAEEFRAMLERDEYLAARDGFISGNMTRAQAAAMVARDRDFRAACANQHSVIGDEEVLAAAKLVVDDVWLPRLLKRMQQGEV